MRIWVNLIRIYLLPSNQQELSNDVRGASRGIRGDVTPTRNVQAAARAAEVAEEQARRQAAADAARAQEAAERAAEAAREAAEAAEAAGSGGN